MTVDAGFFVDLFFHTLSMWWVIIPSIFLGLIVGAIPGFSAANTIIILLPVTLLMDVEVGLVFMVDLYSSSRLGAGIPAILVVVARRKNRDLCVLNSVRNLFDKS